MPFICAHPDCAAELHPTVAGDEFAYADATGAVFVSANLHDQLDAVEQRIGEAREAGRPTDALFQVRHQLRHQIDFGAWGHTHLPDRNRPTGLDLDVPDHCGWPMRLTPTGWACRRCPHRGENFDGLALLAGAA